MVVAFLPGIPADLLGLTLYRKKYKRTAIRYTQSQFARLPRPTPLQMAHAPPNGPRPSKWPTPLQMAHAPPNGPRPSKCRHSGLGFIESRISVLSSSSGLFLLDPRTCRSFAVNPLALCKTTPQSTIQTRSNFSPEYR